MAPRAHKSNGTSFAVRQSLQSPNLTNLFFSRISVLLRPLEMAEGVLMVGNCGYHDERSDGSFAPRKRTLPYSFISTRPKAASASTGHSNLPIRPRRRFRSNPKTFCQARRY